MPFWVLPAIVASLTVLLFAALFRCHRRCTARRRGLPSPTDESVLLEEDHASGYSHRSLVTKVGGARGCVKLVVTREGVVVDLAMPLALVAEQIDLCHRIAFSAIERVTAREEPFGTECVITFRTARGLQRQLSVFPEAPERFLKTLRQQRAAVAA